MHARSGHFDAIIIGTGQAGKPLARALGQAGWATAIIEKDHVGGTCINVGCTPTKTMVASARVAYLMGRAADFGVAGAAPKVDLARVRARKQSIVESFRNGSRAGLERTPNAELIFGEGRFVGPRSIAIHRDGRLTREITGDHIFINTGGRATVPRVEGIEDIDYLDNASIMELEEVPEHLLVMGGGYIGVEFAQMFRRFGSEVTIVQRGRQLLSREDPDVAEAVGEILAGEGITLRLESTPRRVRRDGSDGLELTVEGPGGTDALVGSHVLAAAGRSPNTDSLGLEHAGIETDRRGFVVVNDRLETSVPGIWALGDVKGGPQFTHIAYDDYRIVADNLLKGGNATLRDRLVPYTVFIDPELGRVGLSETEADQLGLEYRVAKLPMTHVARALERDETRGFMKALVDAESGRILGCAILGVEGGEVMSVLQVAMMGNLPYTAIRDGIFAHPTLAESLNNLFMAMDE